MSNPRTTSRSTFLRLEPHARERASLAGEGPRIVKRILVALALFAAPAHAATYWVSPTGSASASGADSLSNAKSLAWFNANAAPGDICRFKSGTYATAIQPNVDGTASNRIRYYGFPQDPGAVRVTNIQFGYARGDYCTVKWVTTTDGLTGCYGAAGQYPVGDSLVNCRTTNGGQGLTVTGKSCVFDSLQISGNLSGGGQQHWISLYVGGNPAPWFVTNNVIKNCTFTTNVNVSGDLHIVGIAHGAYNTFYRNTFNVTVQNVSGYFFGVEQYEGYYNNFQENVWNFAMSGSAAGSRGLWCHRDSSSYNRYVGNTVNVTGSGGDLSFMLSNSGSYPGTTGNNYYGGNFIKNHRPQGGTGVFWFYDGTRRDTLEFNTIATDATNSLISIPGGQMNGTVIRHNTFITSGATAIDAGSASASNNPRLASNIYYCRGTNGAGAENIKVPSGARLDSAGVFFSLGSSTAARAISYGGTAGAPGSGGNYGLAAQSKWGSPRFADSTFATLDPRVASPGIAVGSNWTDGFAGAVPFATGDAIPPVTVGNLAVTQVDSVSAVLAWTAPGDDGLTGTASQYDLRWSASPITSVNFTSATPVSPQPVPITGGLPQTYVALGLARGTTYHFALRTRDEAGNWSGVSNSVSATTTSSDTIPPAAINDLSSSP